MVSWNLYVVLVLYRYIKAVCVCCWGCGEKESHLVEEDKAQEEDERVGGGQNPPKSVFSQ